MFSRIEMFGSWLQSDPIGFVIYLAYLVVTVLLSLILHECAHGYVAWQCGDPTAKMMGRLTLDPRKHLDPIGTVSMFLIGVGWAKPVPVNPRNFQNYRRDDFLVSIAGIVTNLTVFILCTVLSVIVHRLMVGAELYQYYAQSVEQKTFLYDAYCSWLYSSMLPAEMAEMCAMPWLQYVQRFLVMMQSINLSLAVFNLLPIPPLDGFHLLNDTLLQGRLQLNHRVFQITHIALLVLCFSGMLSGILSTVTTAVMDAVVHLLMLI